MGGYKTYADLKMRKLKRAAMLLKNRYCPVTGDYLGDDIVLMTNHCAYCRDMENRRRIHRLCIYTLAGHKYDVKDMCFSAGGHLLATVMVAVKSVCASVSGFLIKLRTVMSKCAYTHMKMEHASRGGKASGVVKKGTGVRIREFQSGWDLTTCNKSSEQEYQIEMDYEALAAVEAEQAIKDAKQEAMRKIWEEQMYENDWPGVEYVCVCSDYD
ncbi:hypothetical protein Tco_0870185 [Tanacetum coccineum]